jgi:hypothetical protein
MTSDYLLPRARARSTRALWVDSGLWTSTDGLGGAQIVRVQAPIVLARLMQPGQSPQATGAQWQESVCRASAAGRAALARRVALVTL